MQEEIEEKSTSSEFSLTILSAPDRFSRQIVQGQENSE